MAEHNLRADWEKNERPLPGGALMAAPFEYGRVAFEFAEDVDRLSDPDEVANAIRRIMSPFGLELYGFLPGFQVQENASIRSLSTSSSPNWATGSSFMTTGGMPRSILSCAACGTRLGLSRMTKSPTIWTHEQSSSSTVEGISGSQTHFLSRSSARPAGMALLATGSLKGRSRTCWRIRNERSIS